MPFNTPKILQTPYTIQPVPKNLIQSSPNTSPDTEEQKPHILWVGCSDSSILETDCLNIPREAFFVHRNLGHLLSNGDLNSQSALEWGVELLQVNHIIVCGHYNCGMVPQSSPNSDLARSKEWYKDVTKLHTHHSIHITEKSIPLTPSGRKHRYEEIYVLAEVDWLKRQPVVKKAIEERGMQVHAFVYDEEMGGCMQLVSGSV